MKGEIKRPGAGAVQLANILAGLIVPNTPTGAYRVGKHYAEIMAIKAPSASETAKRGQSEIHAIMSCRRTADAKKAWALFEALRRVGIPWCSGFLGLFAAGHLQDVVGVLQCLRWFYWGDVWWADRLEEIVTIAPIAVRGSSFLHDNSRWCDFDSGDPSDSRLALEARRRCTLEESVREALDMSWALWEECPRDVASLSAHFLNFPASAYVAAGDDKNTLPDRENALCANLFWFDWLLR